MDTNATKLSINTEVLEKMAEIAAKEIDGVTGMSKRAVDLMSAVKSKTAFKSVKVESVNGALKLTVYICVNKNARVREVAEKVQENIKEKLQNMTGNAITQVDVVVADICIEEPEAE